MRMRVWKESAASEFDIRDRLPIVDAAAGDEGIDDPDLSEVRMSRDADDNSDAAAGDRAR
jgi:hypothetical protein